MGDKSKTELAHALSREMDTQDIVKTIDLTEWERLAIETFTIEMMRNISGSDRIDRSFGPVRCLFELYRQLAEKVKTHGR
jgi:hypothetical protein